MLLGLQKAHVVKLSDDESEFLTGMSQLEDAGKALWHDELKLMVVTRGRAGCVYLTRDFSGEVESFTVDAVDATGAGDGFVAGFACKVCSPIRPPFRMKRGCANCAASPTRWARWRPLRAARFRPFCRTDGLAEQYPAIQA
jgi:fructose-1-phosphate kinase PfkB-like protein